MIEEVTLREPVTFPAAPAASVADLTQVSVLLSLLWRDVPCGVEFAPDSGARVFVTRSGLHRAQAEEAAGRDVNGNQSSARPWRRRVSLLSPSPVALGSSFLLPLTDVFIWEISTFCS